MVELEGRSEVVGPTAHGYTVLGPVQGETSRGLTKHMWYDGAPHQGAMRGMPTRISAPEDAVYLNDPRVSFAILKKGRWDEVAS